MWQEDRHQRIRTLLGTLHRVSTERIVADLGVSRETVRRDLLDLEAAGELKRVHGGAIKPGTEAPIAERAQTRVRAKTAIARASVGLLSAGQTLFLDAGTTTTALAEELAKLENLTIVTNSLDAVIRLRVPDQQARRANEVILLGGPIGERALATCGAETVREIQRYRADFAMLSPVGVAARHGASNFDRGEAEIALAMCERADRVVILADYSKIGQCSRVTYCATDAIDTLVTNRKAGESADGDAAELAAIRKRGARVMLV